MRRETKPRSSGGIKPLREWETLRAAGAAEVKQHKTDHLSDFAERTKNHTGGVDSFHHFSLCLYTSSDVCAHASATFGTRSCGEVARVTVRFALVTLDDGHRRAAAVILGWHPRAWKAPTHLRVSRNVRAGKPQSWTRFFTGRTAKRANSTNTVLRLSRVFGVPVNHQRSHTS